VTGIPGVGAIFTHAITVTAVVGNPENGAGAGSKGETTSRRHGKDGSYGTGRGARLSKHTTVTTRRAAAVAQCPIRTRTHTRWWAGHWAPLRPHHSRSTHAHHTAHVEAPGSVRSGLQLLACQAWSPARRGKQEPQDSQRQAGTTTAPRKAVLLRLMAQEIPLHPVDGPSRVAGSGGGGGRGATRFGQSEIEPRLAACEDCYRSG
jgi:hypothetical protein